MPHDRASAVHKILVGLRINRERILKRSKCILFDERLPVPDEVVSLRRQLGLDYGKIDYVIHDNQVVILDVNKTPGSAAGGPEITPLAVKSLSDGIWSLLPKTKS
jgi:hypothetical protein